MGLRRTSSRHGDDKREPRCTSHGTQQRHGRTSCGGAQNTCSTKLTLGRPIVGRRVRSCSRRAMRATSQEDSSPIIGQRGPKTLGSRCTTRRHGIFEGTRAWPEHCDASRDGIGGARDRMGIGPRPPRFRLAFLGCRPAALGKSQSQPCARLSSTVARVRSRATVDVWRTQPGPDLDPPKLACECTRRSIATMKRKVKTHSGVVVVPPPSVAQGSMQR